MKRSRRKMRRRVRVRRKRRRRGQGSGLVCGGETSVVQVLGDSAAWQSSLNWCDERKATDNEETTFPS